MYCCARDGLLTHQSLWVRGAKGEEEREKEIGNELRLLTDGCQRGAGVLLGAEWAQAVSECVCVGRFL